VLIKSESENYTNHLKMRQLFNMLMARFYKRERNLAAHYQAVNDIIREEYNNECLTTLKSLSYEKS